MKKLLCTVEAAIDIKDAAEVKEELSRFGKWLEDLVPKMLDLILEIAFAFVFFAILINSAIVEVFASTAELHPSKAAT